MGVLTRFALALLVAALTALSLTGAAGGVQSPLPPEPAAGVPHCVTTTWDKYARAVKRTWRFSERDGWFRAKPKPGRKAQQRLGRLRAKCDPRQERKEKMRRYVGKRRAAWRFHAYIDRITPYGKWAIPPYIVGCESGGAWGAYNPSGASGPYQLLGWGAPMPASTPRRKAQHHIIAARLWAGGRGASHWVCA